MKKLCNLFVNQSIDSRKKWRGGCHLTIQTREVIKRQHSISSHLIKRLILKSRFFVNRKREGTDCTKRQKKIPG